MLDTVRLRSPYLDETTAALIELKLIKRLAIDMSTLTTLWEFTTGSLEGSHDSRISVQVKREEYRTLFPSVPGGRPLTMLQPCAPYLVVEGSVHKAMLGHNVTGGPTSFQASVFWFVDHLAQQLGKIQLPAALSWIVEKIDWTECYQLPYSAIEDYITSLNACQYPRRKVLRYASQSIFVPGTTTAIKVYHKGPEFAVHDRKRIEKQLGKRLANALQSLADGIMRVEVSIKSKKLQADNPGVKITVDQVTDEYLNTVHDTEVTRLLKEGVSSMVTVRTHREVKRRLCELYQTSKANSLFGVWMQLATIGEKEVRSEMSKATFYRYRKDLVEAGCTWQGTDIVIRKTAIPEGFTVSRFDPRRMLTEDPKVAELLARYRQQVAA